MVPIVSNVVEEPTPRPLLGLWVMDKADIGEVLKLMGR